MEGKIVSALSQADTELSKFVEQQSVLSVRVEEEVSIDHCIPSYGEFYRRIFSASIVYV